jgi:hypothetical protein
VHIRIFQLSVIFQTPQIFFSSGVVLTVNALNCAAEAKHEINLPVVHGQKVKIRPGGSVPLLMELIELPGIFFKFRYFRPVAGPGNVHHQNFIGVCLNHCGKQEHQRQNERRDFHEFILID